MLRYWTHYTTERAPCKMALDRRLQIPSWAVRIEGRRRRQQGPGKRFVARVGYNRGGQWTGMWEGVELPRTGSYPDAEGRCGELCSRGRVSVFARL